MREEFDAEKLSLESSLTSARSQVKQKSEEMEGLKTQVSNMNWSSGGGDFLSKSIYVQSKELLLSPMTNNKLLNIFWTSSIESSYCRYKVQVQFTFQLAHLQGETLAMNTFKSTIQGLEIDKKTLQQKVGQLEVQLQESIQNANLMAQVNSSGRISL